MNFKAIGFDYGGVIAGLVGNELNQKIEEMLGVSRETRLETYFKYNQLFNNGFIPFEALWQKILTDLEKMDKYEELIALLLNPKYHEIHPEILSLIDVLKKNGYLTGLLSNNTQKNADKMKEDGVLNHFDAAVISAEVGCSKPDPKIFELFCQRLQVKPEELIFIDDSEKNSNIAKELGIHSILYTGYESLIKDLKNLNLNISI